MFEIYPQRFYDFVILAVKEENCQGTTVVACWRLSKVSIFSCRCLRESPRQLGRPKPRDVHVGGPRGALRSFQSTQSVCRHGKRPQFEEKTPESAECSLGRMLLGSEA